MNLAEAREAIIDRLPHGLKTRLHIVPTQSDLISQIESHLRDAKKEEAKLARRFKPITLPGKALKLAARVPFVRLLEQVGLSAQMLVDQRAMVHETYRLIGQLSSEGRNAIEFHNRLGTLLANIDADPKDESLLLELETMFVDSVLDEAGVSRDLETDQLLDELMKSAPQEQKARLRETLLSEARQTLDLGKPAIDLALTNIAMMREELVKQLIALKRTTVVTPITDKNLRAGAQIQRAELLDVQSLRTTMGQMTLALGLAFTTAQTLQEVRQLGTETNKPKLIELANQASQLSAAFHGGGQLSLPERTPSPAE